MNFFFFFKYISQSYDDYIKFDQQIYIINKGSVVFQNVEMKLKKPIPEIYMNDINSRSIFCSGPYEKKPDFTNFDSVVPENI